MRRRAGARFWRPGVLGVLWVLGSGLAVLLPTLVHGIYFGPYDILSTIGLTSVPGATVHNPSLRDLISLFIPFTQQAWTQVHHGQLPLWNPDTGLGLPLAFNWESAPFGLPALVGYLAPVRLAYTVGVLVTVVVASTGAYVFGRVIRLGVIASALVGATFLLCGPVISLLGWSSTSVTSWTGWLFAAAVVTVRGGHRVRSVAAFAVVVALAVYAGHPETALLVFVALGLFLVIVLLHRSPWLGGSGPIRRPATDLVLAAVAGAALSAPLLLPGLQLIDQSGRTSTGNYSSVTIPDHSLLQLFFQGFDGMPTAGSHWFGSVSYQWTADYIGVIALVLGVVAIGVRWKRPEVRGLTIMVALMATLGLVPGVASAINGLPVVGNVILSRALAPLAFGLSVLAGVGMDALIREYHRPRVRRVAGGGFVASGVLLAAVWLFGRGRLPADEARIREASFLWPVIGTLVGLVVVGGLTWAVHHGNATGRIRAGHLAGGILLACETAFLMASGAPTFSSAPNVLEPTPAVASLQQAVGPSLVGLGTSSCIASTYLGGDELGILPEANSLYQVRQFAIYDPLAPTSYFSTWDRLTGTQGGSAYLYQFCPAVTSVTLARRFGVGYVLEARGAKGPPGSTFVRAVGDEALYRIPGVAQATVVPAPSDAPLPSDDAVGTPVNINQSDPATISVVTHAARPQVLRLRVTDVPGWRATIDGRPLTLLPYSGVMLQARVPAGHHLIVIRYWPTAFTVGLILAIVSALSLITAGLVAWRRDRRPEAPSAMDPHPPL